MSLFEPPAPRVLPRPIPRYLTNPTPRRRWNTDLATVTRTGRVRAAFARITRRAA